MNLIREIDPGTLRNYHKPWCPPWGLCVDEVLSQKLGFWGKRNRFIISKSDVTEYMTGNLYPIRKAWKSWSKYLKTSTHLLRLPPASHVHGTYIWIFPPDFLYRETWCTLLVRDQEINMLMVWWDISSELTLDLVTPYWEKNGQIKQMKHLCRWKISLSNSIPLHSWEEMETETQ